MFLIILYREVAKINPPCVSANLNIQSLIYIIIYLFFIYVILISWLGGRGVGSVVADQQETTVVDNLDQPTIVPL